MGSSNLEQEEGCKRYTVPKEAMPPTPPSGVAKEDHGKGEFLIQSAAKATENKA